MRWFWSRVWEELTLTKWRPTLAALLPLIALATLLPGELGEWLPRLMLVSGIWLVLLQWPAEVEAQKRRKTPYPSNRSLNLRAVVFGLLATGSFALAWSPDLESEDRLVMTFAGLVFIAFMLAYGYFMKLPGIRRKMDSTK